MFRLTPVRPRYDRTHPASLELAHLIWNSYFTTTQLATDLDDVLNHPDEKEEGDAKWRQVVPMDEIKNESYDHFIKFYGLRSAVQNAAFPLPVEKGKILSRIPPRFTHPMMNRSCT